MRNSHREYSQEQNLIKTVGTSSHTCLSIQKKFLSTSPTWTCQQTPVKKSNGLYNILHAQVVVYNTGNILRYKMVYLFSLNVCFKGFT